MMKNLWSKTDMTEISLTGQSQSGGKHWVNEKKEEKKKERLKANFQKKSICTVHLQMLNTISHLLQ